MASTKKNVRVVPQVVLDKGADEVVAVVVAIVQSQLKRRVTRATRLLKEMWFELIDKEFVALTLVDEDKTVVSPRGRQLACC